MIYKDFKLEWFFPDSSYVNEFFSWNQEFFASGKPVTVYMRDINYFEAQSEMDILHTYMLETKFVDQNEAIEDWHCKCVLLLLLLLLLLPLPLPLLVTMITMRTLLTTLLLLLLLMLITLQLLLLLLRSRIFNQCSSNYFRVE